MFIMFLRVVLFRSHFRLTLNGLLVQVVLKKSSNKLFCRHNPVVD